VGPVVGLTNRKLIGRPGTYSPYDTESDKWRERVQELIGKAAAIVVVVSRSEGLAWEIRRLCESEVLFRTVFVLPPLWTDELKERITWLISELGMQVDVKAERVLVSGHGSKQLIAIRTNGRRLTTYWAPPQKGGYMLVVKRTLRDIGHDGLPQ